MRKLSIHLLLNVASNIEKTDFFPVSSIQHFWTTNRISPFFIPDFYDSSKAKIPVVVSFEAYGSFLFYKMIRQPNRSSANPTSFSAHFSSKPLFVSFSSPPPPFFLSSFSFFLSFPPPHHSGISSLQFSGERLYRRLVDRTPAV